MTPSILRVLCVAFTGAILAACSGSGSSVPSQNRSTAAGKMAAATFTIKWTNPAATVAMRRKDTISPAAQSITVTINGKSAATANRGSSPTQTIALDAPVGTDQFVFNVYDKPAGQGNLIGSAQVNQLIVDGAANSVSAAIQAVCSVTNVSVSDAHPVSFGTYAAPSGTLYAQTLTNLVLMGQFPTTLAVEPEDIDGDVIIVGTAGTVPYSLSGPGAYAYVVDGSHLELVPGGGQPPTQTPTTLTVASSGCPSTTVSIKDSPAIYAEAGSNVIVFDWYGDVGYYGTLQAGDGLIGFDSTHNRMIAYDSANGQVSAYDPAMTVRTPLYTIATSAVACYSNSLGLVFYGHWDGTKTTFFTYNGTTQHQVSSTITSAVTAMAASTYNYSNGFATNGSYIYGFNLSIPSLTNAVTAGYTINSLAVDDNYGQVVAFNASSPYVTTYPEALTGSPTSSNAGLAEAAVVGAADTDYGDIFGIASYQVVEGATPAGVALPGLGNEGPGGSPPLAIVVVSGDE